MKTGIHPDYHPVVYRDASADFAFLTRSTATPAATVVWEDGNTYPVIDVEVSSASHPFYTGNARVVDTAGRVEKFRRRYGQTAPQAASSQAVTASQAATVQPDAPADGAAR